MKSPLTAIAVLTAMITLASTSYADAFKCTEIETDRKEKFEIVVTELETITNKVSFGKAFDNVYRVQVQVYSNNGTKLSLLKNFEALAKNSDVQYNISAIKKQGFSFWRFLDEEDQDGAIFYSATGQNAEIRLNCQNL